MKTIILLAIFGLFLIVVSSNAKSLSNDNDMELTDKRARMFLRTLEGDDDDDDSDDDDNDGNAGLLDTRQTGKQCVKCKFGIAPCCAPNFCRKKFLRPDECVEVKTGK